MYMYMYLKICIKIFYMTKILHVHVHVYKTYMYIILIKNCILKFYVHVDVCVGVVKPVWSVSGRHDDDVGALLEPVH